MSLMITHQVAVRFITALVLLVALSANSPAAPVGGIWEATPPILRCIEGGKQIRRFQLSTPSWESEELTTRASHSRAGAISADKSSALILEYSFNASTVTFYSNGCEVAWQRIYPALERAQQINIFNDDKGVLFSLQTITHYDIPDENGIYPDPESGGYYEGYVVIVSSNGTERLKYGPIRGPILNKLFITANDRFGYITDGNRYLYFEVETGRHHYHRHGCAGGSDSISDSGKVTVTCRRGLKKKGGLIITEQQLQNSKSSQEVIGMWRDAEAIIETAHEYQF